MATMQMDGRLFANTSICTDGCANPTFLVSKYNPPTVKNSTILQVYYEVFIREKQFR